MKSPASGKNPGNIASNRQAREECERRFAAVFAERYAHYFEFLGGRTSSKGKARLRCKVCGHEFEKVGSFAQYDSNLFCPRCHVHRDDEIGVPVDGMLDEHLGEMYASGMMAEEIADKTGIGAHYVMGLIGDEYKERHKSAVDMAKQREREERLEQKAMQASMLRDVRKTFDALRKEMASSKAADVLADVLDCQGKVKMMGSDAERYAKAYAPVYATCKHCGKTYLFFPQPKKYGRKRPGPYCSKRCRCKHNRISSGTTHRLRKYGNADAPRDAIKLDDVIARDNGICYICGCKTSKSDYGYVKGWYTVGATYPTIDHVKPLARGGTHTWDNVRLACHQCNATKGAR